MKTNLLFFKNLFWEILGKGLNVASVFIINFFLANYLGPEFYGNYSYIIVFSSVFLFISEFGLERIEIRETVVGKNIIESSLLIRLIFSFVSYLFLIIIASIIENDENTKSLICIYAISNFATIGYVFRNFFLGKFKNIYSTIALNSKDIFSIISKLILIHYEASIETILYFSIADFFIESLVLFFIFKLKFKNYVLKFNFSQINYLINKSFPLLASGLLILAYKKCDLLIINYYLDDFATGIYSSAQKTSNAVLMGTTVVLMVYGPILNKSIKTVLYPEKRMLFLEIIISVTVLLSLPIFIFSEPIIMLVFSEEYITSVAPFRILILKNIFESIFLASGYIIIIQDIQKRSYLRNIFSGVFSLLANFIFIPIFGIIGASYISLCTYIFAAFLSNLFVTEYKFLTKLIFEAFRLSELRQIIKK